MDDATRERRREEIAEEVFALAEERGGHVGAFLDWLTDWVIETEELLARHGKLLRELAELLDRGKEIDKQPYKKITGRDIGR
jgi:hypothetical protein